MEIPYYIVAAYKDETPAYMRVYKILMECVARHLIDPSSKLTEVGISKALGVSRTPVRIAMNMLKSEGVLQNISKTSLAVRDFSRKDRSDLLVLVELLEGKAACFAAQRAKPEDIVLLRDLNRQREAFLHERPYEDDDCVRDIHLQMHLMVAKMSGNSFLYREIAELRSLMRMFRAGDGISKGFVSSAKGPMHELTFTHEKIIDALEAKDSTEAELWTRIDIRQTAGLYVSRVSTP